jgi:hypothetical protein
VLLLINIAKSVMDELGVRIKMSLMFIISLAVLDHCLGLRRRGNRGSCFVSINRW